MCFKFGVLYAKAGQKTDNEMYSNGETTSVNNLHMTSVNNFHPLNLLCI